MRLFEKVAAAAAPVKKGGFDFVEVPTPNGVQRMSKSQFESQPLADRIRILVQGTAAFFRDGQPVPSNEALKSDY